MWGQRRIVSSSGLWFDDLLYHKSRSSDHIQPVAQEAVVLDDLDVDRTVTAEIYHPGTLLEIPADLPGVGAPLAVPQPPAA